MTVKLHSLFASVSSDSCVFLKLFFNFKASPVSAHTIVCSVFICYVVAKIFIAQREAKNNTMCALCNQHNSVSQNPISTGHWVEAINNTKQLVQTTQGQAGAEIYKKYYSNALE